MKKGHKKGKEAQRERDGKNPSRKFYVSDQRDKKGHTFAYNKRKKQTNIYTKETTSVPPAGQGPTRRVVSGFGEN